MSSDPININKSSGPEKKTIDQERITLSDVVVENVNNTKDVLEFLYSVFNQSNVILLIWFLAIYFVTYLILGIFYKSDETANTKLFTSRIFDLVILSSILLIITHQYFFTTDQQKWEKIKNIGGKINRFINDPKSILSLLVFIFFLYLGIFLVGIPMTYQNKPSSIMLLESGAWILLCITLISSFFNYFLNTDLPFLFSDFLMKTYDIAIPIVPEVKRDATDTPATPVSIPKDEVFNVSENVYTYDDAQAVCKAYGARLANYDEVEDAYHGGAEWCNYGWSENQMIFFPTQKDTWDKLQKNPDTANKCGRPGINGGYIDNPYLTFGVNCFGVKPKPTEGELEKLRTQTISEIVPETPEQQKLNEKVKYWKQRQNDMKLNAFNHKEWSEYS